MTWGFSSSSTGAASSTLQDSHSQTGSSSFFQSIWSSILTSHTLLVHVVSESKTSSSSNSHSDSPIPSEIHYHPPTCSDSCRTFRPNTDVLRKDVMNSAGLWTNNSTSIHRANLSKKILLRGCNISILINYHSWNHIRAVSNRTTSFHIRCYWVWHSR